LCLLVSSIAHGFLRGKSFFSHRSQSVNAARELVGWQDYINVFDPLYDDYGCCAVTAEYTRSGAADKLASYFFGTDRLVFSGSRVPLRIEAEEILADYFGLPLDFSSKVCFRPCVQNIILDASWYWGLERIHDGLYVRMHAPLAYSRWDMGMCETNIRAGDLGHPAGYMASSALGRSKLLCSVTEAFKGCKSFGDSRPLEYGKINGAQNVFGMSEIQVAIGCNFLNEENYHLGLNLRTSVPTGNRSTAEYFFEPIIGSGGHWELGLGATGHGRVWQSEDERKSFAIYGDLNASHLFSSRQRRSYDLKGNGPGSRYMLIEEMGAPLVSGLQIDGEDAKCQYHGTLMPAINKTSLMSTIYIALQLDAALAIAFRYNDWGVDVGYNLWARTSERVSCRQCLPCGRYAVKGDAQLYGYDATRFVALNATQNSATIHTGQEKGNANLGKNFTNTNADNYAAATFRGVDLVQSMAPFDFGVLEDVNGSKPPIFLRDSDIDGRSGVASAALSHKFFAHINHSWRDVNENCIPFLGFGGEIEFDGSSEHRVDALSQWGFWIKAGLSY
jgi:hypothetical protein